MNQEIEVSSMLLMKSGSEHRLKASVFQAFRHFFAITQATEMTPYIKNMTLRKPVVDEQWLSLNRTIHQVAPLCRNPEHLENAARVLQAEGGLEALARLITTEQTAFLVLAMLEKCGAFQRTAVINGGPCVRISAGVSADAPRKAGVELTRQQMMKIRFSISISPEMRSMCYDGKIPYPDGTIFEKDSTGYFHTKGCRRTKP